MRYRSFPPGPALAAHVECLWSLVADGPPGPPEPVWPDGCLELVFHLAAPFRAWGGVPRTQPRSLLVGQLTGPLFLEPEGSVRTFGVRFRPGGARPFFDLPLDRIAGGWVRLDSLWGAEAGRWEDALASAPDDLSRARLARGLLTRRLEGRRFPPDAVEAAIARVLAARGAIAIGALARDVGWSPRRLERRFRSDVGATPKTFARMVRFQSLLERLPDHDPDWVALALDLGYFDQSHLIADVRALTGVTPSAIAGDRDRLAALFTSRARLADYFVG